MREVFAAWRLCSEINQYENECRAVGKPINSPWIMLGGCDVAGEHISVLSAHPVCNQLLNDSLADHSCTKTRVSLGPALSIVAEESNIANDDTDHGPSASASSCVPASGSSSIYQAATAKNYEPKKRVKLKGYDLMQAQMLNCMGASGVETIPLNGKEALPLDGVTAAMAKGNRAAAYFTEFYDEPAPRKGIAISRVAELEHQQYKEK